MQSKNTLKVHFSKSLLLFPGNVQKQLELGLQFSIPLTCGKRRCYYGTPRGKSGDDLFECTFWIDRLRAFIIPLFWGPIATRRFHKMNCLWVSSRENTHVSEKGHWTRQIATKRIARSPFVKSVRNVRLNRVICRIHVMLNFGPN